jgi:putative membrane protein
MCLRAGLALALCFTVATAWSQGAGGDKTFITKAIQGNLAEVDMGKLAQKQGGSQGVRDYGMTLQQDHSAALQKAKAAAKAAGVTPPSAPSSQQKADYDHLAKMSGPQFDRAFLEHMVKDHKKDISEYEKAAKNKDQIGSYASEALPTLRKHLQTAESLASSGTTGQR